jgi:hypothetical protein
MGISLASFSIPYNGIGQENEFIFNRGFEFSSTNFRIYLGSYDDENGYIYCKINGDSIYVEQRENGKGLSFNGTQ